MSLTQRKFSSNLINENKAFLRNDVDYKNTNSDIKKKSLTCNFDELPHWLQDNVDILTFCILGSATISVAIPIRFRTPEFRWFRTTLFVAL
ncbi:12443_t:CDS:2, partial [Gigaspora rosea]